MLSYRNVLHDILLCIYFFLFVDSAAVFLELVTGILLSTKLDLVTNFLWIWFVGGHTALGLYFLSGKVKHTGFWVNSQIDKKGH